jgi:hypothetical protein
MRRPSLFSFFPLPRGFAVRVLRNLCSLLDLRAQPLAAIPRPGKRIGRPRIH